MKEIKAFVHRAQAGDIVHALMEKGFDQISLVDVKGALDSLAPGVREYSVQYGTTVIAEVKLEVVCPDEDVERVMEIILTYGRASRPSGWAYVSALERSVRLEFNPRPGKG